MLGTAASLAGIQNRLMASIRNCATNNQTRLSTSGVAANSANRKLSGTTIVLRRWNRSAKAPASGPRTIAGRRRNSSTPPRAKLAAANPVTRDVAVAVMASSPSQSPKLDRDIDSHSLRKSRTRSTARILASSPTPSPAGTDPGAPEAPPFPGAVASGGTGVPGGGRPSAGTTKRSSGCSAAPSRGSGAGGVGSDGIAGSPGRRAGAEQSPQQPHGTGQSRPFL